MHVYLLNFFSLPTLCTRSSVYIDHISIWMPLQLLLCGWQHSQKRTRFVTPLICCCLHSLNPRACLFASTLHDHAHVIHIVVLMTCFCLCPTIFQFVSVFFVYVQYAHSYFGLVLLAPQPPFHIQKYKRCGRREKKWIYLCHNIIRLASWNEIILRVSALKG